MDNVRCWEECKYCARCTYVTAIHASKKSLSKKRMRRSCLPFFLGEEDEEDAKATSPVLSSSFDGIVAMCTLFLTVAEHPRPHLLEKKGNE